MIELGRVTDRGVEVTGGLARGDLIVAAGVDRLIDGQPVRTVGGPSPSSGPSAAR